ncbi:DHH family phosphoesterase, partial [Gordonibacter pamelaeae]
MATAAPIIVVGHKNPDNDSICAAVGYASLKNELARRTGLSFPTVSRIVDDLVEAGEAKETGTAASTGGRCAKQYALDPAYRLFLCLRLEGRRLSWFVCDLNGTRLEQEEAESTNGILHDI